MHDLYADLHKETGVKVIAVSVDDSRSSARVGPMVASRGWPYTILLDPNADLKRSLNVVNVPHTFLVDASGRVVYQHSSYNLGDEDELAAQIRKIAVPKKSLTP